MAARYQRPSGFTGSQPRAPWWPRVRQARVHGDQRAALASAATGSATLGTMRFEVRVVPQHTGIGRWSGQSLIMRPGQSGPHLSASAQMALWEEAFGVPNTWVACHYSRSVEVGGKSAHVHEARVSLARRGSNLFRHRGAPRPSWIGTNFRIDATALQAGWCASSGS